MERTQESLQQALQKSWATRRQLYGEKGWKNQKKRSPENWSAAAAKSLETRRKKYGSSGQSNDSHANRKYSIQDCHKVAIERNGRCLSDSMQTTKDYIKWECEFGHQWTQRFCNILTGTWCKQCSLKSNWDKRRPTIDQMRELAQQRGGECLSETYIDGETPLRWKCQCGFEWDARPQNIKSGCWCLRCHKKEKHTKGDLDAIAVKNGGLCLSSEFKTAKTKYKWRCGAGHEFESDWDSVHNAGHWCAFCRGFGRTLKDMQELAQKKGGKCLSKKFRKMVDKLKWQCSSGHTWTAAATSVWSGSWCPKCKNYFCEEKCRFIAESLTGYDFPSTWFEVNEPLFHKKFQLDCYSEKLKAAIEHHGRQHYDFYPRFHKTIADFERQQKKDCRKQELCKERGISLITVPYWVSQESDEALQEFITTELDKLKVSINGKVDFNEFYIHSPLEKLIEVATKNGGKCLATSYTGPHTRIEWECSCGHRWKATAASVKCAGTWCPPCRRKEASDNRRTHDIDEMKRIAIERNGECLSDRYDGLQVKLTWKCQHGHTWQAVPASVIRKQGTWCPYCYGKHKTVDYLQELAAKRGGLCLATTLKTMKTKVEWQCSLGHRFETTPERVQSAGAWCSVCVNIRRSELMKERRRNGQMLSKRRLDYTTIEKLCSSGMSVRNIAKELHCSRDGVRDALKRIKSESALVSIHPPPQGRRFSADVL